MSRVTFFRRRQSQVARIRRDKMSGVYNTDYVLFSDDRGQSQWLPVVGDVCLDDLLLIAEEWPAYLSKLVVEEEEREDAVPSEP